MRFLLLLFCLLFLTFHHSFASIQLEGTWQGILYQGAFENPKIIYLELKSSSGGISGFSKEEFYATSYYQLKTISGSKENNKLVIKEGASVNKKLTSSINLCNYVYELEYNDSTGYLSGSFYSTTCRNILGKACFYRSSIQTTINHTEPLITHNWVDIFIKNLKKKRKSPEKQEEDRKNFQFHPIYFDYDKDEIKGEYVEYLKKMAAVVDGHSDLRIKATGHTDSDGSDHYNEELSRRRAQQIQNFFYQLGLEDFKVIIDFKGEKMPVDNNATFEGKQRNRRVDFEFI